MKIAYIKLTNSYSDYWTYQENILPACFTALGNETHLLVGPKFVDADGKRYMKEPCVYQNDKGVCIHVLPSSKRCKVLSTKFDYYDTLYSVLEKIQPDFIFSHSVQYAGLMTLTKYKRHHPNICLVADNHGDHVIMPINTLGRKIIHKVFYRYFVRKSEKAIDCFYGVSPSRAKYLTEVYGVDEHKVKVIPQVGDDSVIIKYKHEEERKRLCEKYDMSNYGTIITFGAGNIDRKKNLMPLVMAMKSLPKCALVVFGTFSKDIQPDLEKQMGETDNVFQIGRLSGEEIYRTLIGADLAVFPGQHSVLWDNCVACGTPLCVRKWEGMDYFNINGNCEYLSQGDEGEILSVLNKLVSAENMSKMRDAAQGKAKDAFSSILIAKRIIGDIS